MAATVSVPSSQEVDDMHDKTNRNKGQGLVLTREQLLQRRKKVHRADENQPIIVLPEGNEANLINSTKHICLECSNFDIAAGQHAIFDQKFWHRMMHDEKYRQEWFENSDSYGFCRIIGEHRIKPATSRCTMIASDNDSSLGGTPEGIKPIPCPHFVLRSAKGSTMSISRSHVRELDRD